MATTSLGQKYLECLDLKINKRNFILVSGHCENPRDTRDARNLGIFKTQSWVSEGKWEEGLKAAGRLGASEPCHQHPLGASSTQRASPLCPLL